MAVQKTNNLNFINFISKLPDEEYLLSIVAYGAAPTIREDKPSSLITFTKRGRNLYDLWRNYGLQVSGKLGLDYSSLRDTQDSVRILFYKKSLLEKCISREESREFLDQAGYDSSMSLEECISKLKDRFEYLCPHEIGIFLGIPVQDVVGFIDHNGDNSLLCSYWKVYHDPDRASELFKSFDKAREDVLDAITKYNFNFLATA